MTVFSFTYNLQLTTYNLQLTTYNSIRVRDSSGNPFAEYRNLQLFVKLSPQKIAADSPTEGNAQIISQCNCKLIDKCFILQRRLQLFTINYF